MSQRWVLGFTIVASFTMVLGGCFKPQRKSALEAAEGLSSFTVEEVKGSSEVTTTLEGYSMPTAKKFTFKACAKDRKTDSAIANYSFVIEGDELNETLVSDPSGCVSWNEEFEYNFIADETYIELNRVLRAQPGIHAGAAELKIAINPWNLSGKNADVVDLGKGSVEGAIAKEEELAGRLGGQIKPTRATPKKLSIARFELASEGESEPAAGPSSGPSPNPGVSVVDPSAPPAGAPDVTSGSTVVAAPFAKTLSFAFDTELLLQDFKAQSIAVPLKEAKLQLAAALIVASGGQKRLAWSSAQPIAVKKAPEGFVASLAMNWGPADLSKAKYLLVIKLVADEGPQELQSFEAAIDLGSHAQLMDVGILPEKMKAKNTAGAFSYDESIKGLMKLEPVAVSITPAIPVTPAVPPPGAQVGGSPNATHPPKVPGTI